MSNYFEIFGLPVDYELDLHKLEEEFLALQQQFHPDKYINESGEDKTKAMHILLELNEAYNVLKCDVRRAEYLMKLSGIDTTVDVRDLEIPEEILQEAFEDRENLEDAASEEDLDEILKKTKKIIELDKRGFLDFYRQKDLKSALGAVLKIKYKSKFLQEAVLKKMTIDTHI